MKQSPTMIDAVIRESLRPHSRYVPPGLRPALLEARKFVLDDGMSAFLAELSHRPFAGKNPLTQIKVMDSMRVASRLPHKTTWVELNARAYKQHVLDNWPDSYDATGGPEPADGTIPRIGWLMQQHKQLDTAFTVTVVCDVDPVESPVIFPFAFGWVTDDAVQFPWERITFPTAHSHSELACGLTQYNSSHIGYVRIPEDPLPLDPGMIRRGLEIMREFIGELRHVFAFLSSINDLPAISAEVKPSKGYFARGSYKKFVDHTTITLKVPGKASIRSLAERTLASAKRRHTVRGHWRLYLRGDDAALCLHEWNPTEDKKLVCPHCKSWKTWITEHERGDASLGHVTHDYKVQHDESQPNHSVPAKIEQS